MDNPKYPKIDPVKTSLKRTVLLRLLSTGFDFGYFGLSKPNKTCKMLDKLYIQVPRRDIRSVGGAVQHLIDSVSTDRFFGYFGLSI